MKNEEKTEFDVILKDSGPDKIKVINLVRTVTRFGLREAQYIVDEAPQVLKENVSKEDAENLKSKFAEIGAVIEII